MLEVLQWWVFWHYFGTAKWWWMWRSNIEPIQQCRWTKVSVCYCYGQMSVILRLSVLIWRNFCKLCISTTDISLTFLVHFFILVCYSIYYIGYFTRSSVWDVAHRMLWCSIWFENKIPISKLFWHLTVCRILNPVCSGDS